MTTQTGHTVSRTLRGLGSAADAEHAQRYFKTGPGQYGFGDRFIGVRVPVLRKLVKTHAALPFAALRVLLQSEIHEERLFALLVMVHRFTRETEPRQTAIHTLYLENLRAVNNWDLVDCSAPTLVGAYLADRDKQPLYTMAASDNLWHRRIAMLAAFHFIRNNVFDDALAIAAMLRDDPEELIHKAVGWMLREIGKRDIRALTSFLDQYADAMPRTMLRYAIEKFPEPRRQYYLRRR